MTENRPFSSVQCEAVFVVHPHYIIGAITMNNNYGVMIKMQERIRG